MYCTRHLPVWSTSYHVIHPNGNNVSTKHFYRPQMKLRKGNVFTPVCQSFCLQGRGCLPQCMLGYTPPLGRQPPSLWADIRRTDSHPGRPPPGRHTPYIRLLQRTYTSYWNAYLLPCHFKLVKKVMNCSISLL